MVESRPDIRAAGPHCGVCAHVTFLDDWDRTPYCTHLQREVEISTETVCDAFER